MKIDIKKKEELLNKAHLEYKQYLSSDYESAATP
jgi:hypothetical protein